jgi:hypothetical protein
MSKWALTETGRDRAALAQGAGFGRISFVSVLAGVLVAYGAMAVLLSAAAAIAEAAGIADRLSLDDWTRLGVGSAAVVVAATLVSYLFGGYVAGRMARRAGLLNGLATFVLAVLLVATLGALLALRSGTEQVAADLVGAGIPAAFDEWGAVGSLAGLGSLVAMLVGALVGGKLGERWHSKLTRRAAAALADRDLPMLVEPVAREVVGRDRVPIEQASTAERVAAATRSREPAGTGGRHLAGERQAARGDTLVQEPEERRR